MTSKSFFLSMMLSIAVLLGSVFLPGAAYAQSPRVETNPVVKCDELATTSFSGVEDAPAKIVHAELVAATASAPGYCEVTGYTWRHVGFDVRLPIAGWNGKLIVYGTGGQAGSLGPEVLAQTLPALAAGFATATHDGGHASGVTDAQWAYQDEAALLDYAFRAPHVAGLVAKAIVQKGYGRPARLAYFDGCSNGGREALQMAQRYPYDYNGIIAGDPSMRWSELFFHLYWLSNRLYVPGAPLDRGAIDILHRNVLDQCDRLDGKADGIIDNPLKCHVDLARVECKAGSVANCLSPAQAKAAQEVYDGPRDTAGHRIAYSSALPGSELAWLTYSMVEGYPQSVFRYETFMPAAGPGFVPDESLLGEYATRTGGSDALLSATNPDLRKFRDNGGKLLSYMGWSDPIGGVRETLDYHDMVERVAGGRAATQDFYRLFMIPGMNHCGGGEGAFQIDWVTTLDKWVDKGEAPDSITGVHPNADGSPAFAHAVKPFESDGR